MPDDSDVGGVASNDAEWGSRGRDPAAFAAVVERHGPYLYGIAHALCGNAADAEDLVQETFEGALRSRFRGEASLRTFLVRILVRRVAMLRRWRRRKGQAEGLDYHTGSDSSLRQLAVAGGASQSGDAASAELAQVRLDLTTMLETLSPEFRSVLILREREGLSYAEIAAALNIPRGTVESRLHRARAEIRRRFKDYFS